MKFIVYMVLVVGLCLAAWQVRQYLGPSMSTAPPPAPAAPAVAAGADGDQLPGLPPKLEPALEAARQRGAAGLHDFLASNGARITDPRLASIQLDYVLLVAQSDPAEARRVFAKVKQRLAPSSPVYERMQELEKTYE